MFNYINHGISILKMYSHVSHKSDYVQVRLKRSLCYFIFKSKYIIEQSRRTNSKPKVVNLHLYCITFRIVRVKQTLIIIIFSTFRELSWNLKTV